MARLAKFDPLREKANEIAEKVADLHINSGVEPSVAVSMQKEAILSDNFLDRVVESTNLLLFKHAFATQSDKRAEFPTADSNKVREIMSSSEAPKHEKVSSVWDKDLADGEVFAKRASVKVSFDEYGNQLDDCGFPISDTLPELSNEIMVKRAATQAYEQTQKAAETLREMNFEKISAIRQIFHSLKGYIKQANDRGQELSQIAMGLVNSMDTVEKRADASYIIDEVINDLVSERNIKIASYQEYMEKVSDIDVTDSGHVIHRGADQIIVQLHTCLGYMNDDVNGSGYGVAQKNDHHGFLTVDENMPYEVKAVKRVDQSRPALVRGKYF